jgi:hypothetical protein
MLPDLASIDSPRGKNAVRTVLKGLAKDRAAD